jgi:hypothetical protein
MKKLKKLRIEKDVASKLELLPGHVERMVDVYYQREIDDIEKHNADNPDVSPESVRVIEEIAKKGIEEDSYGN